MTLHPNHHRVWKLYTGLQATWAMSFSTLPPDSRTLVSKWNTKLALIWKEDFGQLGNSPVLLLLSPVKTPLTTTVAKFLDTSVCGSWCLDPSLSPFLVKFTQILESILLDNPHKAAVLLVGCASFSSTLFPSTQLSVNMLGYSTLWTASFFGNECLWLTLLVKGVNDCLLDNCLYYIFWYLILYFHYKTLTQFLLDYSTKPLKMSSYKKLFLTKPILVSPLYSLEFVSTKKGTVN